MRQKAVIDRIVDGQHAVVLVGEEEREIILPVEQLPAGIGAGIWLQVELEDDLITEITIDPEETARVERRIAGKMALLRRRHSRLTRREDPGSDDR
jgi:hypothetical protein